LLPYNERQQEEYWKHLATHQDDRTPKKRLQNLPPSMKAKKNFGMIQQIIQIMEAQGLQKCCLPTMKAKKNVGISWQFVQIMET
jgi:hypothetical protein